LSCRLIAWVSFLVARSTFEIGRPRLKFLLYGVAMRIEMWRKVYLIDLTTYGVGFGMRDSETRNGLFGFTYIQFQIPSDLR